MGRRERNKKFRMTTLSLQVIYAPHASCQNTASTRSLPRIDDPSFECRRRCCRRLTDGQGLPLSIVAAPANRHNMKLVAESLAGLMIEPARPHPWRQLCMDLGCNYQAVRNRVWEAGMVP